MKRAGLRRADRERRDAEIRGEDQMKANLLWWSKLLLQSFKESRRELEIVGQIVRLFADRLSTPEGPFYGDASFCLISSPLRIRVTISAHFQLRNFLCTQLMANSSFRNSNEINSRLSKLIVCSIISTISLSIDVTASPQSRMMHRVS